MRDFATRVSGLDVEGAFEVLVRASELERAGQSVVHLEIGEPDFPTPAHIVEAAKSALDAGYTKYGPAAGLPELREAVARHIVESRGVPVTSAEVVITPGAKPIMFFAILALVEAGDEVIYPDPGFPIYASVVRFTGGTPVPLPLLEGKGFSFDVQVLERLVTPRTRLLILNSPENPTGGIVGKEGLECIAALSQRFGFWVLSDEVYHRFCYEGGACQYPFPARDAIPHDSPGWLLEKLRHDRLASGLRRDAGASGRAGRQTDGQLQLLHRHLCPEGGGRGAHGGSVPLVADGGGLSPATGSAGVGAKPNSWNPMPTPGGGVLHLPERSRPWTTRQGDC